MLKIASQMYDFEKFLGARGEGGGAARSPGTPLDPPLVKLRFVQALLHRYRIYPYLPADESHLKEIMTKLSMKNEDILLHGEVASQLLRCTFGAKMGVNMVRILSLKTFNKTYKRI